MNYNMHEITCKLTRIELCDILLACLAAKECSNDGGEKWIALHDKIDKIIDDFDDKNIETL